MKKLICLLLLSVVLVTSLTGCGKDKTEDIQQTQPQVVQPVRREPSSARIGDVVLLQNDNIPYLIVGNNYRDVATKQDVEFVAVFYPKGAISGELQYVGFSLDKIEFILTEDEKSNISNMGLNIEPTLEQVVNANLVFIDLDPVKKAELQKMAKQYTVYTKTVTDNGISIGVQDVEYFSNGLKDRFIFHITITNDSNTEIIANGRLDIRLTSGHDYECDDSLIDAKDIINFKIPPRQTKSGKIAYEVPAGTGNNLKLIYKSDWIPETVWYLYEKNPTENKGN